MRTQLIGAVALSALSAIALSGCNPKPLKHAKFESMTVSADDGHPLKTVSTLDCPDHEGDLTRTAQAADGKSCDYQGPNEEAVHLSLVSLDGRSAADVMAPVKTELQGLVPPPPASPVAVEASKDEGGDHAKIDLPFLHINADGDKADVKIMGTTIHANGKNADIHTNMGLKNTTVHAGPGGAEIVAEDVGKVNASMVYILAGDSAGPGGYKAVGYIARGPKDGPLVVGQFKAKGGHHRNDEHSDLGRLIDRNVKG